MKKLLSDNVVRGTLGMILLMWGISACSAVTGVAFSRRHPLHVLSASEIRDWWHLPLLLTIVWTPIILWRSAKIFRRPVTLPATGAADRERTASTGVYVAASLLLFFGIALACNFAGDPQRWRGGVIFLAVCTLPFVFIFLRRFRLRHALGRAELHLDGPIRPGFRGTARYVRPLRGAELKSVDVHLSCEEHVTKHVTSRLWVPKNRVLHEETIKPQVTPSSDKIEIRIPLHIPTTGTRSIATERTTVIWWLRLRLHMSGCPDTTSAFAIEVV